MVEDLNKYFSEEDIHMVDKKNMNMKSNVTN